MLFFAESLIFTACLQHLGSCHKRSRIKMALALEVSFILRRYRHAQLMELGQKRRRFEYRSEDFSAALNGMPLTMCKSMTYVQG